MKIKKNYKPQTYVILITMKLKNRRKINSKLGNKKNLEKMRKNYSNIENNVGS